MAEGSFRRKIAWNYKPSQVKPRLNIGNPITRGLVFCPIVNEGHGSVLHDISLSRWDMDLTSHTWVIENGRRQLDFNDVGFGDAVGSENILKGVNAFTISCVVTADSWVADGIFGKYNTPGGDYATEQDIAIGYSPSNIVGIVADSSGGSSEEILLASPSTGVQYTFLTTYDGVRFKGYVDGIEVFDVAQTLTLSTDHSVVISDSQVGDPSRHFDGRIDHPRIWNRALSATEVRSIYNNQYQVIAPTTQTIPFTIPAVGGVTPPMLTLLGVG